MKKQLLMIAIVCSWAADAGAATWYGITAAITDREMYFFDMDTVLVRSSSVTIYIKSVNDQSSPDSEGSYARAEKTTYECSDKTFQVHSLSTYDKTGNLIKTATSTARAEHLNSGTVGEAILRTVCMPGFPKVGVGILYYRAIKNDVFAHAAWYFERERKRALTPDPAPKW